MFGVSRTTEWIKRRSALRERNRKLREITNLNATDPRRAWFITTLQDPARLEHWKNTLKPSDIILIDADTETLIARVKADPDRSTYAKTQIKLIKDWKRNHGK